MEFDPQRLNRIGWSKARLLIEVGKVDGGPELGGRGQEGLREEREIMVPLLI